MNLPNDIKKPWIDVCNKLNMLTALNVSILFKNEGHLLPAYTSWITQVFQRTYIRQRFFDDVVKHWKLQKKTIWSEEGLKYVIPNLGPSSNDALELYCTLYSKQRIIECTVFYFPFNFSKTKTWSTSFELER